MADATDSKSVGGNPMRVRLSPRASACIVLLATAPLAYSQQSTLHGTVVSAETGEALGFSTVTLLPTQTKRFTDSAGTFTFAGIRAGTYLLSVRQIAYAPLDTQIVVLGDTATTVRLALRHLAVELPPVTITAQGACTQPGAPDRSADPALAAVFDQLVESAHRLDLLDDANPFRFRLERTVREVTWRGDTIPVTAGTIELDRRETRRPYRPGHIVGPGWGPFQDLIVVTLASLHELGDSVFHRTHCFQLAGRDTIEGETLVRIDFAPAARLGTSDIAGSAYLDSLTYRLRFTVTSLTRPERSGIRGLRTLVARTRFRDVAPGVALQDYMRAVTTFGFGPVTSRMETQSTIDVRFRHR